MSPGTVAVAAHMQAAKYGRTLEVAAALAGDDYTEQVRADLALAHQFGISGVRFVFDRTYGVSGARKGRYLLTLNRVWTETHPPEQ